jgi:hypothetical protein
MRLSTSERRGYQNATPGQLVFDTDQNVLYTWTSSLGWTLTGSAVVYSEPLNAKTTGGKHSYTFDDDGLFVATYAGDSLMFYTSDIGNAGKRTSSIVYYHPGSPGKIQSTWSANQSSITAVYNGLDDNFTVTKVSASY